MSQQIQQDEKKKQDVSIKGWLLGKAGQYIDGILINALTGLTLGSFLWIVQRFWGLRLIPFNVLDAVLLSLVLMIVFLLIIVIGIYFLFRYYLNKHPEMAVGVFIGLIAAGAVAYYMRKKKENDDKGIENTFANIFPLGNMSLTSETETKKNTDPPSEAAKE